MHKKYNTPAESSRIYSNDLYFAAVLHSQGYELEVIRNERRRVTFVFKSCVGTLAVREEYRSGRVTLDMHAFRESLKHIRRLMDSEQQCRTMDGGEQRSDPCPETQAPATSGGSRMQLSRA